MTTTVHSVARETAPADPPEPRPLRSTVLLVLVGVTTLAAVAVGVWMTRAPAQAPYDDPAAVGRLTLCGADGKPVTEGSTTDRPLAASVVGSTGSGTGSAALFAYQPRQGVDPTEWTGLQLSAAAALGDGDTTLSQFLAGYPASYDGWVQLRLYRSAPDQATQTLQYDALDLHVDGHTWRADDPGSASCAR